MQKALAVVTVLSLLSVGCASAGLARGAFVTSTAMLVCDGIQTIKFAADGWQTNHESNPMLGVNPSVSAVGVYFVSAIAINTILFAITPAKYRVIVPAAVIAIQADSIAANAGLGGGMCGIGQSR